MSYGFEAYRADGSTMVSTKSGVARIIFSTDKDASFSGNISVPAFDSNLGFFTSQVYPYLQTFIGLSASGPLPDNNSFTNPDILTASQCFPRSPNLSWNNSTKVLSVSPNTEFQNNREQFLRHRYRIIMVHYK